MTWKGIVYRCIMKIAHKFHWHYAPPCYPDGDTQLWCRWCGFRQTVKFTKDGDMLSEQIQGH